MWLLWSCYLSSPTPPPSLPVVELLAGPQLMLSSQPVMMYLWAAASILLLVDHCYGAKSDDVELYQSQCPSDDEYVHYSCVASDKCSTLRARSSIHFCDRGDERLICCPLPAQKVNKCGQPLANKPPSSRLVAAVIGGISLRSAVSSPWMVAVGQRTRNGSIDWYCGGALIQEDRVLTAAHCTLRRKPDVVRVGELDFARSDDRAAPQDVTISAVKVHPFYQPPEHYHDIAVLQLANPVEPSQYISTICLPQLGDNDDELSGKTAMLYGWGLLGFGGEKPDTLQEASVIIFNNSVCNEQYSRPSVPKQRYPQGIIDSQLCAGHEEGGKDACQGDSGGPLVLRNGGVYTVVGIVSSGVGCGSKSFPGIYTRVSSYVTWIQKQL
ncbi:venom protease-like [Schistocerca cancellata]|uniref:venom protease-like n=1 Tax=Schistocerca cancellata TaxID=274614 RepID=UPI0021191B87|nr:venom protease-like [Schistocerca cancellata]